MDKRFLATYLDKEDNTHGFDWLEDEEDVEEWLEQYKDRYSFIEVIEIKVVDVLYQSEE